MYRALWSRLLASLTISPFLITTKARRPDNRITVVNSEIQFVIQARLGEYRGEHAARLRRRLNFIAN